MEMPKPTEHHRKLDLMVGEWTGKEQIHATPFNPTAATATSTVSTRKDLDGFWVLTDYVQRRNGQVSYCGHGVFGYDVGQQHYTLRWFDVMGTDPGTAATGTWQGQSLVFDHHHDIRHTRYTYIFGKPNSYDFKLEFSEDGSKWVVFLEANYKKS